MVEPASSVLTLQQDGLLHVTLNRPDQRNALSPDLVCNLADLWDRVEEDDSVKVVVLTGSGSAFCAGADLHLMIPLLTAARQPDSEADHRMLDTNVLARAQLLDPPLGKPVVCAVNGAAVAGGFELMLGTDIRVASSKATFGLSEVRRGLLPGGGGISRLPRQVARIHALELLLTGEQVKAHRALAMGLVNYVVSPEELTSVARRIAMAIAGGGPLALREIKDAVNAADGLPLGEARKIEQGAFQRVMQSKDAIEGALAFMEKRSPCFTGE